MCLCAETQESVSCSTVSLSPQCPHLVSDQTVAGRTLLAARGRAVVEVVLLTHVTASSDEAGPTLAASVLLTLTRLGALWVAVAGWGWRGKHRGKR